VRALDAAGRADAARNHGERYVRERSRLAASPQERPELRGSFLARLAPL